MNVPVLADQQELIYNISLRTQDVGLKDMPRAMDDRDGWRERIRETRAVKAIC